MLLRTTARLGRRVAEQTHAWKTAERVATVEAAHAMNSLAWHPQKPVLAYAIDAKSKPDGRTRDEPPYLRLHSVPLPSGN